MLYHRSILIAFLKRQSGLLGWLAGSLVIICFLLSRVEIPELRCRLAVPTKMGVSIVNISGQEKEIEKLSSKALFLGPSDEKIPEDLKLKEWDEMKYIEPVFAFP